MEIEVVPSVTMNNFDAFAYRIIGGLGLLRLTEFIHGRREFSDLYDKIRSVGGEDIYGTQKSVVA